MYQILLYYKYTDIKDPKGLMVWHRFTCSRLSLKGRIIVAHEGINGTLEGRKEDTEEYIQLLTQFDDKSTFGDFRDIVFKKSNGKSDSFPKMKVKVREEIVSAHLGEDDVNPQQLTGTHLPPEELRKWFKEGRDFTIVDMRNSYEFISGHFKDSIDPGMDNFRDLPKAVEKLEHLKNKTVVTVCTGGVRCEKASGYLKKKGFNDVYQLDGGIVKYMEKYPGEDFLGTLYVFDNRVTLDFDDKVKRGEAEGKEHDVVGACIGCGKPSERYVNCDNLNCHLHFICCEDCNTNLNDGKTAPLCPNGCVSTATKKAIRKGKRSLVTSQ